MDAENRVALVTGASRGLGYEIARLLAARGIRLAIAARGAAALHAAAEVLARSAELVAIEADVAEDAERVAATALGRFGRVDILINNASELGPSPMPPLETLDWRDFLRVLRVNVAAPLHLAQLLIPQMRRRGAGVIVNVSSDAGVNAYPGWGGYGASKAALEHLSRTLAAELAGSGIRVYVVDPGDMNTQMHRDAEPGMDLSHLPGPEISAPAFVHLIEKQSAPFGRFEARRVAAATTR